MWVTEKTAARAPEWSAQVASKDYKTAQSIVDYVGLLLERIYSDTEENAVYQKYRSPLQNNRGQVALDENTFHVFDDMINDHMPGLKEALIYHGVKPFTFEGFANSLRVIVDLTHPDEKMVDNMEIESGKRILFDDISVLRKLARLHPQATQTTSVSSGFLSR